MMSSWTNDPLADFSRHCDEQEERLASRPKCSKCDEPIQDDFCYEINDEYICEECLKSNHRKWVDDIVQ